MNLTESKNTGAIGVMLGITAAALAFFGNPKNMAICIACFYPGYSGSHEITPGGGGTVCAA